ncbi:hypothetical protein EIP86_000438 [Pleurotus ostreatoroseus]|nr:hypothetical protein EIP86_000438 [Pleurotus ostreatoroseus]
MSKKEVLGLMSTCRALFNFGLPKLFQRPYKIDPRTLQSFYDFLLFGSPSSFLSLQDLTVPASFGGLSITVVIQLINILSKAINLRSLVLLDYTLYKYPTFYDVIPHLKKLRFLKTGDSMSYQALTSLRSPLVQMSLTTGMNFDPIEALAHFSDTLQEVSLVNPQISCAGVIYPHVVRLVLTRYNPPLLSTLIPIFPNAQELIMTTGQAEDTKDTYKQCKERNVKYQKECRQWSPLVSLRTNSGGLFGLALQHSLTSLSLLSPIHADEYLDLLEESLKPLHLVYLAITYVPGPDSIQLHRAIEPTFDTLQRLDLKLDVKLWKKHYQEVAFTAQDHLFQMLKCTRLHTFTCVIQCPTNKRLRVLTEQIDAEEPLARRAVVCVRTLKNVSFSFTAPNAPAPSPVVIWEITSLSNGEKQVAKIADENARHAVEVLFKSVVKVSF